MPSQARHFNMTTTGIQGPFSAPGGLPFARFNLQLKGVGAAPTSWTVAIEGSHDRQNWTSLLSHASGVQSDGATVFVVDKPVLHYRINLSALVLGSATAVDVYAVANTY
jgi:hypothetical protein